MDVIGMVLSDGMIGLIDQGRGENEAGGRTIAGDGDIAKDRDPEQGFDVDVVREGLHGVSKEDNETDMPIDDHPLQLPVASERSRLDFLDLRPLTRESVLSECPGQRFFDQPEIVPVQMIECQTSVR